MTAIGSQRLRRVALPLLASLAISLILACGGGDEAPGETPVPAPAATEAPAETPTAVPSPTAAPQETPTAEAGGADEPYLRVLCGAGGDLQDAILAASVRLETGSADLDDPEIFAELFAEPIGAFLEAMRGVAPPADLAEYHPAALAAYETFIEVVASPLESGRVEDRMALLDEMLGGAADAPALPAETLARLARVAADIPECAGSPVLASFLGQDGGVLDGGTVAAGPDPVAEAYVRELCLAGDAFEATYETALGNLEDGADPEGDDPASFAAVFHEALRGLAADLAPIAPPDGYAGPHAAAIGRYEEMVAVLDAITGALDAGAEPNAEDVARFEELLRGGLAMPGLSSTDANRLGLAANNVPACFGSGFLFGLLAGGQ